MTELTNRLLGAFNEARQKMARAATRDEMTEALCLMPSAKQAFGRSMETMRSRIAVLPEPKEDPAPPRTEVPEALEFPPIEQSRRIPIRIVGWFCGALALALIISFVLGFASARGGL